MTTQPHQHQHEGLSPWKRFWERGGWWKAVLLAAVYLGVYLGVGQLLAAIYGKEIGEPTTAGYVLLVFVLPILIGGIVPLAIFAGSLGWIKRLFQRQPATVSRHWWMWIAVGVILLTNISRFASIDYDKAGFSLVAAWLLAGLMVGFAEETLTRGLVVNITRYAGHPEIGVAALSAGVFAALHFSNILETGSLPTTLLQLVYTFAFGICMYLSLRITGNLIWPILLHASTDPSIFLQTSAPNPDSPLALIANFGNFLVIAVGIILFIVLIFSGGRDRAMKKEGLTTPEATIA